MTNPMYCPMSFMPISVIQYINTGETFKHEYEPMECTPDCAWALELYKSHYGCAMSFLAGSIAPKGVTVNVRPLKDDAECMEQ